MTADLLDVLASLGTPPEYPLQGYDTAPVRHGVNRAIQAEARDADRVARVLSTAHIDHSLYCPLAGPCSPECEAPA